MPETGGTVSEYVVVWFPPEGDKQKRFGDSESRARGWAGLPEIAEWNPILLHRVTVTVEEVLPLSSPPGRDGSDQ